MNCAKYSEHSLPLPLAGEVGARSASGEGGATWCDVRFASATLIRPSSMEAGHLLPPAGEGNTAELYM